MAHRRRIARFLKAAALVLVVALLYFVFRRIGFRNILDAMRRADPGSVGWATVLFAGAFLLWTLRWKLLIRGGGRCSILTLLPIMMAGVFGNLITPGARVGGGPIRAYYLSRAYGREKSACFGTVLADKLSYALVFLVFLLVSVAFAVVSVQLPRASKLVLGGAVLLVLAAVVSGFLLRKQMGPQSGLLGWLLPRVYEFAPLKLLRRRFPTYQHFEDYAIEKLTNVWGPVERAAGSPRVLVRVFVTAAASWLLVVLAHYLLFRGLGAEISFPRVLVIVTISTFFGDVSVSPGGAGFMEAAMLGLCAAFGVDARTAAAATLISRGIFYILGIGVGGLCLAGLAIVYGRRQEPVEEPPVAGAANRPVYSDDTTDGT